MSLEKKLTKYLEGKIYDLDYEPKGYALNRSVREFLRLNNAIKKGWEVWAVCEKQPRNLDSGKHWFQIYYLSLEKGKPTKNIFWVTDLMDKNRDRSMRGFGFSSGAIGMSRLLDATNHIFCILKECGGEYKQIS